MTLTSRVWLALTLLSTACGGVADGPHIGGARATLTTENGMKLNGMKLNGMKLNGVNLSGVTLSGSGFKSVTLQGTLFSGTLKGGSAVNGTGFVGSNWVGLLSNGTTLTLRVDSMAQSPTDGELWNYAVQYYADGLWQPLCGTDSRNAIISAIPVAGTWDYNEGVAGGGSKTSTTTKFTFACRSGAIAKCVESGYKPWKTPPGSSTTLANHHQACTRLIRADYCGDGTPWTQDGRLINLYDFVGVQSDTESWTWEATWGVGGATCLFQERVSDTTQPYPACFSGKPVCSGQVFTSTLLVNEYKKQLVVK